MAYTPTTWRTGDYVTAEKLNKTENAVDANDAGVEENGTAIANLRTDLTLDQKYQKLLCDDIPNTVQTYIFDDGDISQVLHKSGNTTVRTDAYTFTESATTEVRTLDTGEKLTIVTDNETSETTITYTAT